MYIYVYVYIYDDDDNRMYIRSNGTSEHNHQDYTVANKQ